MNKNLCKFSKEVEIKPVCLNGYKEVRCKQCFEWEEGTVMSGKWGGVIKALERILTERGQECGCRFVLSCWRNAWWASHAQALAWPVMNAPVFFFFFFGCTGLSYSMWDLFPWPGIEPRPPALRAWSLSHWITREIQCSSLILWFGATDGFLMVNHLVKVDFISFQIYFLFLKMHKEMCSL